MLTKKNYPEIITALIPDNSENITPKQKEKITTAVNTELLEATKLYGDAYVKFLYNEVGKENVSTVLGVFAFITEYLAHSIVPDSLDAVMFDTMYNKTKEYFEVIEPIEKTTDLKTYFE